MSLVVEALAWVPIVAVVIVVLAALWDRHEVDALNRIRALDLEVR